MKYYSEEGITPELFNKVFLCGTKMDVEKHCELLADKLVRGMSCAVFYEADPDNPEDENYPEDVAQMQLIALIVSREFLSPDCKTRIEILEIAKENNIPLMPIVVEDISWEAYYDIFGSIEALEAYSEDETKLNFSTRLEQYKRSILMEDEEVKLVKGVFRGEIFLSYRKKDRRSALELVRLIHEKENNMDLAIWYDDYLVPGENYDREIKEAIENCNLFLLNITPNLLEPDNYVIKNEYPNAMYLGKKILAVEVEQVNDKKALTDAFVGLDECIGIDKKDIIYERIDETIPMRHDALKTLSKSPEDECLLGLAYLNGINVEQNKRRGASLIKKAADRGSLRALSKLRYMYETGNGVTRSYDEAIDCQKRIVEYYENHPEEPPAELQIVYHTYCLAMDMIRFGRDELAVKELKKLNGLCSVLIEKRYAIQQALEMAIASYSHLSVINEKMGHPEAADFYRKRAAELINDPARIGGETNSLLEKAKNLALEGDSYYFAGEGEKASTCYDEAFGIVSGFLKNPEELGWSYPEAVRLEYVIKGKTAMLMKKEQAIDVLLGCAEQSMKMYKDNPNRREYINDYVIYCEQISGCYYELNDFNRSKDYLSKGIAVLEDYLKTSDLPQDKELLYHLYVKECKYAYEQENILLIANALGKANSLEEEMTGFGLSSKTILEIAGVKKLNAGLIAEQGLFKEAINMLEKAADGLQKALQTMNMEQSAQYPFMIELANIFYRIAIVYDDTMEVRLRKNDNDGTDLTPFIYYEGRSKTLSALNLANSWFRKAMTIKGGEDELRERLESFYNEVANSSIDWMVKVISECQNGTPPEKQNYLEAVNKLASEMSGYLDLEILGELADVSVDIHNRDFPT